MSDYVSEDGEWVYFRPESPLGEPFDAPSSLSARQIKRRLSVEEYNRLLATALGPFPDGAARLGGDLNYEQMDRDGIKSRHKVGVVARVEIGGPRLGLPGPPSYSYNVRFDVDGTGYTRRVPISQWLAPGTTDRFLIYIGADKSSVHDFDLVLRFNDSQQIESKRVNLAIFISRPD